MSKNIEDKIVFGLSSTPHDGATLLLVGVPKGAWEYMKDGKTCHFDLSRIGIPFKLMMFGAEDHGAAMKVLEQANAAAGKATLDLRREDFAIKDKPK